MASQVKPKNEIEKVKILELAMVELRQKYLNLNNDYDNLGTKIFTLIATELVITTFLFTFKITANKPLFALNNVAIIILFGIGMGGIMIAIGLLFWATTSNKWAYPAELKELKLLNYSKYSDMLEEIKDDYIAAYNYCITRYNHRRIAFDGSVLMFIVGAIILMVIKIGGSA